MPKKGRKILDGALKYLRPTEGAAAVDLPDTTPLGYYQAVKAGKKEVSYGARATSSKPGEIARYEVIPFAEGSNPDFTRALIGVSNRAIIASGATGLTAALLNIGNTTTNLDEAVEVVGFVPATATVKVSATGFTAKTSKLTNRPYPKKNGASYTVPFGLGTTIADTDVAPGYKGMKANVIAAVEAGEAGRTRTVSFRPEIY